MQECVYFTLHIIVAYYHRIAVGHQIPHGDVWKMLPEFSQYVLIEEAAVCIHRLNVTRASLQSQSQLQWQVSPFDHWSIGEIGINTEGNPDRDETHWDDNERYNPQIVESMWPRGKSRIHIACCDRRPG